MKSITISMPDELARRLRVKAAEADTSMSQFLCQLAAEKIDEDDAYLEAMGRYLARGSQVLRTPVHPLPKREELYDRHGLR